MVANQDIIGMKIPADQKSEGILFVSYRPSSYKRNTKGSRANIFIPGMCKILTCHPVLLDNQLVVTIHVNQVEPLESPAGGASKSSKKELRKCLEYLRLLLV